MVKWTVVQTNAGHERVVLKHLRRLDLETYCPTFIDSYRRKRFLFPRYVFLKVQPGWQQAFRTVGVSRVLMCGDEPATIPVKFIKRLQSLENRNGNVVIVKPSVIAPKQFLIGEKLRVLRGQFQGFLVRYAGQSKSGKAVGTFRLLGRDAHKEFAADELAAI